MKILVTGAAGFIGSNLCEYLKKKGYDVLGVDNFNDYYNPEIKEKNASDLKSIGIDIVRLDLNDNLSLLFETPFDYIYHLAAQPGISTTTPLEHYVTNNIYATQNLLDFVLRYNPSLKMFINIATSSVYGFEATVDEKEIPKPISFYGTTKLAAEQLALGLKRNNKLPVCSIRLYSVYGPGERPEKLYTKLIESLYLNHSFPLYEGSLKHQRSFTYVGDIINGLEQIIGKETVVNGEIINLGTDEINTTEQGILFVQEIMDKKLIIENKPPRAGDQTKTAAIIDKARKILDYTPQTSFKDGLRKQVDWYLKRYSK